MRQKCWIDLLRDHNCTILCQPNRGIIVDNALIQKEKVILKQLIVSN